MPQPPPPHTPILNTQKSLLTTLCDFLTVAFHTLLFTRSLYPPNTFITTRAYNHAVHQNRHPAVCAWINNTVSHIQKVLESNSVKRIVFVIYNVQGEVMERFLFDVERFPVVEKGMAWVEFEEREDVKGKGKERMMEDGDDEVDLERLEREKERVRLEGKELAIVDIEEQLRATLSKLSHATSRMAKLPEGCTYTVAVELRDDPSALPPLAVRLSVSSLTSPICHLRYVKSPYQPHGFSKSLTNKHCQHPQPWIPSQPSLQPSLKTSAQIHPTDLGGEKSTPIRLVESGEFILETWIEEGRAKFASQSFTTSASSSGEEKVKAAAVKSQVSGSGES